MEPNGFAVASLIARLRLSLADQCPRAILSDASRAIFAFLFSLGQSKQEKPGYIGNETNTAQQNIRFRITEVRRQALYLVHLQFRKIHFLATRQRLSFELVHSGEAQTMTTFKESCVTKHGQVATCRAVSLDRQFNSQLSR